MYWYPYFSMLRIYIPQYLFLSYNSWKIVIVQCLFSLLKRAIFYVFLVCKIFPVFKSFRTFNIFYDGVHSILFVGVFVLLTPKAEWLTYSNGCAHSNSSGTQIWGFLPNAYFSPRDILF